MLYLGAVLMAVLASVSAAAPEDSVVVHHESSGLQITLPADVQYSRGIYDDGFLGERIRHVFQPEVPTDWNAVDVRRGMVGSVTFFAMPSADPDDEVAYKSMVRQVSKLFGEGELEIHENARFGGSPALQFEVRSGYGDMGTLMRHVMVFRNGMRFGAMYNVAYLTDQGDGMASMNELTQWVEDHVEIEFPE